MPARSSPVTGWRLPQAVARALDDPGNETPKPGDDVFAGSDYRIVARPADALAAAAERAKAAGYECVMLGGRLQGEAREVAAEHARLALSLRAEGRRAVILSGGELTVTLRGKGQGGPNQEYALALAIHLDGAPGIAALAADTDGTDGGGGRPDDPAGAFVDPTTLDAGAGRRPRSRRLSRRQQFDGVLQWYRGLIPARSDIHQRHRLPRHRR